MGIQPINFTGEKRHRRSFLGDVASSALNVGATVASGAAVGSVGGKIASLVPYKVKEADMAFQYGDMFLRASNSESIPEIFQGAGESVKNMIRNGRSCLVAQKGYLDYADDAAQLLGDVAGMADDVFKSAGTQEKIRKFFSDAADKIPAGGYNKEDVAKRIQEGIGHAADNFKGYSEYLESLKGQFVETAKAAGNSAWDDIAQKGAKALRNRTIIGAGIAIGVIGALLLNIHNSYKGARNAVAASKRGQQNTTQG